MPIEPAPETSAFVGWALPTIPHPTDSAPPALSHFSLDNTCSDRYHPPMAQALDRKRPESRRFDSPQQEAFLNLWRTYDRLRLLEDELFAKSDLTAQQYNALRLL